MQFRCNIDAIFMQLDAYRCNLDVIREEVEEELAIFTTFTVGGWVGGWCGEVKTRANLSQVRFRLKLRLSLAILKEFKR